MIGKLYKITTAPPTINYKKMKKGLFAYGKRGSLLDSPLMT
jgi:hypothetical protein